MAPQSQSHSRASAPYRASRTPRAGASPPPPLARSPSPHTSSSSHHYSSRPLRQTTPHNKPWHTTTDDNEGEELLVPTRGTQRQTGGSSRYHRPTDQTPKDLQEKYSQRNTGSNVNFNLDNQYDSWGYSDVNYYNNSNSKTVKEEKKEPEVEETSSSTFTSTTATATSYDRYLQTKQQQKTAGTVQRSSSFGSSSTSHYSSGGGRPPTVRSSSLNSSKSRRFSKELSDDQEDDDGDNDNNKEDHSTSARTLRAKRLAQQKHQQQQQPVDLLRLQTANPAVQAYLQRKEQQETETRRNNDNNNLQRSHSWTTNHYHQQQSSQPQQPQRHSHQRSTSSNGEEYRSASAQRRQQHQQQQQLQQQQQQQAQLRPKLSEGRPPTFQRSNSKDRDKNTATAATTTTTTYTYQFQPAPKQPPPPPPPPPPQQQQRPPRANSLGSASSSTTTTDVSVSRARRLLVENQYQYQYNSTRNGGNNSNSNSNASTSSLPNDYSYRTYNSNATTTQAQSQSQTDKQQQEQRYRRASSSDGSDYVFSSKNNQDGASNSSGHASVSRARRLLQEGKSGGMSLSASDHARDSTYTYTDHSTDPTKSRNRRSSSTGRQPTTSGSVSSSYSRVRSSSSGPSLSQRYGGGSGAGAGSGSGSGDDLDKTFGHHRVDSNNNNNNSSGDGNNNSNSNNNSPQRNNNNNDSDSNNGDNNDHSSRKDQTITRIPTSLANSDDLWSIRVCVVSAVDFPVHVVPNMPLSPVLKLGLVSIPQDSSYGKERLLRDIDRKGLGEISDQMRCTSTKLLSKRDNGAVEFHEELRWDNVSLVKGGGDNHHHHHQGSQEQETLALAVELCARGVLRPANLHESPPPHSPPSTTTSNASSRLSPLRLRKGTSVDSAARSVTPSPNHNNAAAAAGGGGADGETVGRAGKVMNFLARKAKSVRGKPDAEMESANAAAAVAKLLVEGSTSPVPPANRSIATPSPNLPVPEPLEGTPPTKSQSTGTNNASGGPKSPTSAAVQEWDVTLRRYDIEDEPKKTNEPTMTDDIRLGSLLIPITEMDDLKRILKDKSQPARIEKWFEVENMNAAIMNAAPPPPSERRWLGRAGRHSDDGSMTPSNSSMGGSGKGRRNPSILLEFSLYAPEVLDESEDEMSDDDENDESLGNAVTVPKSFAKRTTRQVRNQLQQQSHDSARSLQNSPARRTPKRQKSLREEQQSAAMKRLQDPALESGVIDFISIVGARDIGDQKHDDGSKGWVQSTPECCILEQFPPTDDFYLQQGSRSAVLPQKIEWFCFPDGVKLWRGPHPPTNGDFVATLAKPPNFSSSRMKVAETDGLSLALFDAHLNCTTSFNWFVIASNSDEYGSSTQKTYGAVIRFYVPAPKGIDPTQDDFAQTLMSGGHEEEEEQDEKGKEEKKRLWVPIGICITSSIPIVGTMEAVLMRTCEMLASRPPIAPPQKNKINNMIQRHLANLSLNFQQPIPGAVNCSVPFLQGAHLQLKLAPSTGLPPLPHGSAIASVCKLLGPEGFNFMLSALLTESKILLHSVNPAHCSMVAEVMTALIYPFNWSLPYIPVLPMGMLEFIEAPLSYLLGTTTACLEQVDPSVLEDVVVVDLDSGFSASDWKTTTKYKSPIPLPSLVASNISRAVYRLLHALEHEKELAEKQSQPVTNASDRIPRIQAESRAEREFRISVALEMGGLVRGYQDCLVFVSTSQPVFNREKFLKRAPALFIEEPSGGSSAIGSRANKVKTNRRILSSRSKRFLSVLVNCQHFHQFLEMLRSEECSFFHEVMEMWIKGDESKSDDVSGFESSSSFDHQRAISHLTSVLQNIEDKIPTYMAKQPQSDKPNGFRPEDDVLEDADYQVLGKEQRFPRNLLQQIDVATGSSEQDSDAMSVASKSSQQQQGVHHASLSVQYLLELEKNPWRYQNVIDISVLSPDVTGTPPDVDDPVSEVIAGDQPVPIMGKVKLREAIGDRKYRAWKLSKEQLVGEGDFSGSNSMEDNNIGQQGDFGTTLDLASLMTSTTEDTISDTSSQSSFTNMSTGQRPANSSSRANLTAEQQRVANAKDRDVLRRCLEKAYSATKIQNESGKEMSEIFSHHGRDLVSEAEVALRNPSAQHFLLSLLSKRTRLDEQKKQQEQQSPNEQRRSSRRVSANTESTSSSRLEPIAFECVVRLCCAMLDSCMETKDYEPAYLLLCHTAGLFTLLDDGVHSGQSEPDEDAVGHLQPMYMTARVGLHPLFADLGLWQKVMGLHLAEKNSMGAGSEAGSDTVGRADSNGSLPSFSASESFENDAPVSSNTPDEKEYEAAVATLYEMLGYGIPAEELARFATKVSQEYGWFGPGTERGQSLLLLARRLSMRRELGENGGVAPGDAGDLEIMQGKPPGVGDGSEELSGGMTPYIPEEESEFETIDIGWCHPAAPSAASSGRGAGAPATQNTSVLAGFLTRGGGQQSEYMSRSAVTALATFGPSVVVSGGLDGGVFLAHAAPKAESDQDNGTDTLSGTNSLAMVRGLHLDWGSSGSRVVPGTAHALSVDGEYGVGAVSCLAAANGPGGHQPRTMQSSSKDVLGLMDDEDMIREMEDSRVIGGTTCGDLRIWSVKDVYAAMHASSTGEDALGGGSEGQRTFHAGSDSASSSYIPGTPGRRRLGGSASTETSTSAANNPFNRLKFSLRGRALSGHRGGVTCVDVPSHVYRPDSVVTGGADGLIKLWSLRTPSGGRRGSDASFVAAPSTSAGQLGRRLAANRGGDALSVLNGHGGRILCVKTAWHGDRLLSGGADRTIRLWDLMMGAGAGSNDTPSLHTLSGHFGWVTQVQYWGPNTIVSGSTDRSIALWDARVRDTPLFVLRHHCAPISDILVGQRTDPLMVSAASDGSVTTWDFRHLSGASQSGSGEGASKLQEQQDGPTKHCKVVRQPGAIMDLGSGREKFSRGRSGAVLLSRGERRSHKTVLGVGNDAIMREWDISTGQLVKEWNTGHCDSISSFTSLADATSSSLFGMGADSTNTDGASFVGGTLTSSWDGTIRMRKRIPKQRIEC